jgi:membrane protease subunit HflK
VLAQYRDVPDVTRARLYLETLRQVLPQIGSVIVLQEGQVSPLPLLNLRDAQGVPQAPRSDQ